MNLANQLPLFLDSMLKSLVALLLAALVLGLWRRASAAYRHLIWTCAFAAMLFLPLTAALTPRWKWEPVAAEPAAVAKISLGASSNSLEADSGSPAAAETAPALGWVLPSWRAALLAAWLAGAGVLLARRGIGSLYLWIWARGSQPVLDEAVGAIARRIAGDYQLRRRVELRQSPTCKVPLTWGVWRPVVMLPPDVFDWPTERIAAALRHELGHVRRRDCLSRLLAYVACALYWPNPLVWLAARAIHLAQERACDDLVLTGDVQPEAYAAQLLEAAQQLRRSPFAAFPAVAMAQPSTLENRILAIVDDGQDRQPVNARARVLAVVLLATALTVSAVAQVRASEADKAEPAPTTADGAASSATQVRLDVLLVQIPSAERGGLKLPQLDDAIAPANNDDSSSAKQGVLGDAEFKALSAALKNRKGNSAGMHPTMIMKPNQRATISTGETFRCATKWEGPDAQGRWTAKEWAAPTPVGITVESRAKVNDDGSISLDFTARLGELIGWFNIFTGKASQGESDGRSGAIVSRRAIATTHALLPGQTLVISEIRGGSIETPGPLAAHTTDAEANLRHRIEELKGRDALWIFVTPSLVSADQRLVDAKDQIDAPARAEADQPNAPSRADTTKQGDTKTAAGSKPQAPQTPDPATPDPEVATLPYGEPVPGKPGYVTSPYAKNSGYVDVRNIRSGSKVKDPFSGKDFLVP